MLTIKYLLSYIHDFHLDPYCTHPGGTDTVYVMSARVFSGENVVRGDKESIRNLLEIFDGLLEYLKEEINGELEAGGRQI